MKSILFLMLLGAFTGRAQAASDVAHIKSMAGCHEVTFEYTETFQRYPGHPIKSEPLLEHVLELVVVDFESPTEVHLQHILDTPMGPLKHWRQEWIKNPTALWTFQGRVNFDDKKSSPFWTKTALKASPGVWLQRVTNVDDSPRYECAAKWVSTGHKEFWECDAPAPLPRREATKRDDYDVLMRRNRHELLPNGWLHEQDNSKMQSRERVILAEEKGLNTYRDADEAQCAKLASWWSTARPTWTVITDEWHQIYKTENRLAIKGAVAGQPLWMRLHKWADQHKSAPMDATKRAEIRAMIREYLE